MKRKLLYISLIMVVGSVFQGCKKDFLELQPKTGLSDETYYKTETDAFRAVTSIYDALSIQNWAIVPLMSDIWSDDEYKGGSAASDMQEYGNYEYQNSQATDVNTSLNLWTKCYMGIFRANLYLSKQDGITFKTPGLKTRLEAETRFLRAYFYWELERHFGWVPIITKVDLVLDNYKTVSQNTPTEVYKQIAYDLLYAVKNLPAQKLPATEAGRATKYAAEGLLTRIYMFYNDFARNTPLLGVTTEWADSTTTIDRAYAINAAKDIIAQPQYSLLANFHDLFDWNHQNSSEGIFEWQYSELGKSSDWTGLNIDGNFMVVFVGVRGPDGDKTLDAGWSFGTLSWSLVKEFQDEASNDARIAATVYDANKNLKSYTHAYQNTGYFNNKYMPLSAFHATAGEPTHNYAENFIDIRLADVYLMYAELNLTANPDSALVYLNKVRTRSQGASGALTSINLDAIKHERRIELACEGSRKWDLMRWGLPYAKSMIDLTFDPTVIGAKVESIDDFSTKGYLDVTTLGMLPIPATEISKSSVLSQKIPAYIK